MDSANRASRIGSLLDETQMIEQTARSIQEHRPSIVDEEIVGRFREMYLDWYGSAIELLPDDLKGSFSKEYEGGRFLSGINAFIVSPAKPNAVFAKTATENPDTFSGLYFQHPVETTFEPRFIKQQAILRQAQQRYVQLSTVPSHPIRGIGEDRTVDPRLDLLSSGGGSQTQAERGRPVVFIAHGRSLIYLEVFRFLKEELGLEPIHFETEDHTSEQLTEILGQFLSKAVAAVVVMTGEDQTIDNKRLARQNVVHEAGLFQAKLGFDKVVLLKEKDVEQFSNAQGLIYIPLDPKNVKASFYDLGRFFKRHGLG